jgi:hypothetical protein
MLIEPSAQMSLQNQGLLSMNGGQSYSAIDSAEAEEPKVVLSRSWLIVLARAGAQLLPISITACLLVFNAKIQIKGSSFLTPYEIYGIHAAAKFYISIVSFCLTNYTLTKARSLRLWYHLHQSHWILCIAIYSRMVSISGSSLLRSA